MTKGVVLLSGGLDSAVTAYIARRDCSELYALSFDYGQRHIKEIERAKVLGRRLGVGEHKILRLPIEYICKSSLTGSGEIPLEEVEGIPSTWVPQRNSIFLAIAFGWAEVLGAERIYIGVNSVDYSGYPDCRPEFIDAIEKALNKGSKQYVEGTGEISIETPIIGFSKEDIVRLGEVMGVPFELTWSCYSGKELACGKCPSCRIRLEAFRKNKMVDPVKYAGGS